MTMPQYFISNQHELNYEALRPYYYGEYHESTEYHAAFYLFSVPSVFEHLDLEKFKDGKFYLLDDGEELAKLGGGARRLLQTAYSLFTGNIEYSICEPLNMLDEKNYKAFLQAILLRRGRNNKIIIQ
jgi:hypothetical protein